MRRSKSFGTLLLVVVGVLLCAQFSPASAQEPKEAIAPSLMFRPLDNDSRLTLLEWMDKGWLKPDEAIDWDGNTVVHYAATIWLDVLREAIRRGGSCNRENANGANPLHFAAAQDQAGPGPDTIRILLDCGADPNLQDARGATPIHAVYRSVRKTTGSHSIGWVSATITEFDKECFPCSGGRRLDMLQTLLGAGAEPNVRDNGGDTPLMLVVKNRGLSAIALSHVNTLLEHGADPNTRDNDGTTPLILMTTSDLNSTNWHDETAKVMAALLKKGADPDLRDSQGDTPLIHAAKHKNDIVPEMETLLAGGADPCLRDRKGKVAYDYTSRGSGRQRLLFKVGGYIDSDTGICVRDLLHAEKKEKDLNLARGVRRQIQSCLEQLGHHPGTPDGMFGARTRRAIRAWQAAQGEKEAATGFLTESHADKLQSACKVAVSPLCTGQTGSSCWMELSNRSGCYIWNPYPAPEETVTWSGGCVDGKVSGKGKGTWRFRKDGAWKTSAGEGEYRDGKRQDGHWVYYPSDGGAYEGSVVNGKRHGLWTKRGSGRSDWVCFSSGERYGESACVTDVDRAMQAKARTRLRIGPGGAFSEGGVLEADEKVRVTAEAGEWLWVETKDGREGFVQVAALKDLETKNCVVWSGWERLGYWRGPCIDGLASGRGSAVFTATCSLWPYGRCVHQGKEQLAYYEGSAKHGLLSGHGILTEGTGWFKLEGEFRQGARFRGTACNEKYGCSNFDYEEGIRILDEKKPTCEFKMRGQSAVYWLGSCADGVASGEGKAVGLDWAYVGDARDGRAHGWGQLRQYLDVDMDADPVNLFPSFKNTQARWRNGRAVDEVIEELYAPPHYRRKLLR